MPYPTIAEAKEGKFPTTADGVDLTLEQINRLADIYDTIKTQPDIEDPMAIAWASWKKIFEKVGDKWAMIEKETFNVNDKEIFAIGKWKGDNYTEQDLDNMVMAFNELKAKRDVPLKLGHDEKQKLLQVDGYPAAGWVTSLKRVGKKLLASFKDIPKKIKELIDTNAYKNISSEIWWNYKDKENGKTYPRVLTAVALLGADIPAVEGLSDWESFYSQEIKVYTINVTGGEIEITKQTQMKQEAAEMEKIEELQNQIKVLEDKLTGSENDKAEAAKQLSELRDAQRKAEIKTFVEAKKTEGKLLPAHEQMVSVILDNADESKSVKFSDNGKEEDISIRKLVEKYIDSMPKIIEFAEMSKLIGHNITTVDDDGTGEAGRKLHKFALDYQKEHKDVSYEAALLEVSKQHKDLVEK